MKYFSLPCRVKKEVVEKKVNYNTERLCSIRVPNEFFPKYVADNTRR